MSEMRAFPWVDERLSNYKSTYLIPTWANSIKYEGERFLDLKHKWLQGWGKLQYIAGFWVFTKEQLETAEIALIEVDGCSAAAESINDGLIEFILNDSVRKMKKILGRLADKVVPGIEVEIHALDLSAKNNFIVELYEFMYYVDDEMGVKYDVDKSVNGGDLVNVVGAFFRDHGLASEGDDSDDPLDGEFLERLGEDRP